jgi:predicted esterase
MRNRFAIVSSTAYLKWQMKQIGYICASLVLGISMLQGKEKNKPVLMDDTSQWMESAMVGRPEKIPTENDLLTKDQIKPIQNSLWQTYKKMAIRLGWNKDLLPVPPPIDPKQTNEQKVKIKVGILSADNMNMPYVLMAKGEKPADGWPMFISLHGGGQYTGKDLTSPHGWAVNNREWQAQMKLTTKVYQPAGIYFIPRMAHDRWGRWWFKHNIHIFTRVIQRAILFDDVDPNRIYIMGISQGGYGTCHLAPLLADQLAGAGSMAGGMMTVAENLRNLPFRSDIGENDTMYNRINLAKKLHAKLDTLKAKDPEGYENVLAIQQGRGHGIDYSQSPTWMAKHTRTPYPEKIVWRCFYKDGIYRKHFYWISLTETPKQGEFLITATLDKQNNRVILTAKKTKDDLNNEKITPTFQPLEADKIIVHLNDQMLDLDKEVSIQLNGKNVFKGKVQRSRAAMMKNMVERGDGTYAFPVDIPLGK